MKKNKSNKKRKNRNGKKNRNKIRTKNRGKNEQETRNQKYQSSKEVSEAMQVSCIGEHAPKSASIRKRFLRVDGPTVLLSAPRVALMLAYF